MTESRTLSSVIVNNSSQIVHCKHFFYICSSFIVLFFMSGVWDKIEWTHLDFVRRFPFAVALCLVSALVWLFSEAVNLHSN